MRKIFKLLNVNYFEMLISMINGRLKDEKYEMNPCQDREMSNEINLKMS